MTVALSQLPTDCREADCQVSYSQFGEDASILFWLGQAGLLDRPGFYVDVGAFHPSRYSNTYLLHHVFHWRGINIEANPDMAVLFNEKRPADINVTCAISASAGSDKITYFKFNHPAINTLNADVAKRQAAHPAYELVKQIQVPTARLEAILDRHHVGGCPIDYLNIDVEGAEPEVLASNDWSRYRPYLISCEDHALVPDDVATSAIHRFVIAQGYSLVGRVAVTSIYARKEL